MKENIKEEKEAEKEKLTKETKEESKEFLAVILIRGLINVNRKVKDTLKMLNLNNKFYCIVIKNTPIYQGMIKKCKDYITWGEINEETLRELREKRQKTALVRGKKKVLPFFRLHPPRGGFERKGIKTSFKNKGVLGYRGEKINNLIKKML